jgi:hypothetical protein
LLYLDGVAVAIIAHDYHLLQGMPYEEEDTRHEEEDTLEDF